MNQQIHVLFAEFIKLNAKINDHLLNFNLKNERSIETTDIIDNDTLPFLKQINCTQEHYQNVCFENSAANCFRSEFNKNHHSHSVAVRIEFASVNNLSKFLTEMKKQFEQRTGGKSIREISINNCKIAENVMHQIDIEVHFNSSMNHGYLNELRFPTKWTIFCQHQCQSAHSKRNKEKCMRKQQISCFAV